MKLKKSIVLVLVLSMIVTTGIITFAKDRSHADETDLLDSAVRTQFTNSIQAHAPKKHVAQESPVEGKKDKSHASRTVKPPADLPPQQDGRTISYGDTVAGDIPVAGGRDEWTFEGEAGDLIVINMDSDAFDTYLELQYNGETITSNDDYNGLNSQIGPLALLENGSYMIMARPLGESATGSYTLSLDTVTITTLNYGVAVSGDVSLDAEGVWSFTGSTDDIVVIRLSGEGFTPSLQLRSPLSELISSADGSETNDAVLGPVILQQDGLYFIRVKGIGFADDSPIPYELSIDLVDVQDMQGGSLVYGDSYTTTIVSNATHEWTFDGESGDLIVIDVNGADVYPDVEITRPDGLVFVDPSFGIYYGAYGPLVLPFDGTYTVQVTSYSDGIYTISLEKQGTATPGTGGGTLVYDEPQTAIYGQGAPEIWTFDATEGDVITIQVGSETLNFNITLLDSNGEFVTSDYTYDDSDAQLGPFVVNRSDTYTLAIASYDTTTSSEYSVSIASGGQAEPGGGQIAVDESQTSILVGGLEDSWTFEGSEGDVVVIRMSSDEFDTYLVLQDENGIQLAANDDYLDLNSQIGPYTIPADGTYTIVARGLNQYSGGEYILYLHQPTFNAISYGESITGELQPGTIAFWTFEATATDIVRISVNSEAFEPSVSLTNEAGAEIVSSQDYGEGIVLDTTITETGTYTISVGTLGAVAGGLYDIMLEVRGRVEVGDGILEYGDNESGLLSANARDEWTFQATENDVVTIRLTSEDFDTYLELIGPDGQEIARNDDFDDLNSQIGPIALTQSGTYTIIARGYSESGMGAYIISIESNGTAEPGGGELGYGDTVEGVAVAGVVDRWTFEGTANDFVVVRLESDAFDTYLELRDANDIALATNDDFNGLNSQIGPIMLAESGTYTIIARPLQTTNSGSYTLSLFLTELEVLGFGETIGTLQPSERLIYGLDVEAGQILAISVASDEFAPRLDVRNTANVSLYSDDDYEESGTARVGPFTVEEPQRLTILVDSTYGGETGQFTLTIEQIEMSELVGGELSYGDSLATSIEPNVRHMWTFNGERGDLVRINMDSDDFDTFLELNGPDGSSIVTNDDYNGLNSQLGPLVISTDGEYTIIARPLSEGNSGIYVISLVKEGVGTPGTGGGTIQYDETVEGVYATGTPERWTFEGRQGDAIIIRAQTDDLASTLELYENTDTYLVSSSGFDYETNTVELGPLVLPASTNYDVVLSSYDRTLTSDYSLTLEFVGRPESGGGELVVGESVSGTLFGGLQDVWTFEGSAGDTIMAVMTDTTVYVNMQLQNAAGEYLQGVNYNFGSNALIGPYMLPEDGTYRIAIGDEGTYSGGDYNLNVSLIEFQDIAYGDTIEDVMAGSGPVFWHFEATATDIINIVAASDAFTTQLVLMDAQGNTIQYGDSMEGDATLSFTAAETASYTIALYTYDSSEGGAFSLSLTIEGRAELGDGELGYGDTEAGLLGLGARDEWTFDGEEGDTVVIVMQSDHFDTYLELFDSNGEELSRNDDFDDLNSQIGPFTLPADDTYTIIARGFSETATGLYSISVDVFSATQLIYGATVQGTLAVDTNDHYTLDVETGDILIVTVQSSDFYPEVQLRDPINAYVSEASSYSTDEPSQIGPMVLNTTGTYLIVVSSVNDNESGDYSLTVERGEPVESGGQLDSPMATGTLIAGARDEWTFDGVAGTTVTIAMHSDTFDTYLELYDSSGVEIARNDDYDDLNSQIGPLELRATDTYIIIARGYSQDAAGTYTISLAVEDGSVVVDDNGTDSTPQLGGGALTYGDSIVAQLTVNANDQWTFDGTQGDIITISLESEAFDPVLELYNAANEQIARNDDFEGEVNAKIDAFELPEDGAYTIVARAFGNSASGEYTISLAAVETSGDGDTDVPDTVDTTDFVAGDGILEYGETETGTVVAGAQNVYTFDGSAGDVITILVNSEDFDTWAELRRNAGSLLAYNNDGDGTNSVIVGARLPTNNTYQIIVKGASGEDAGEYTVTLLLDDGTVAVDGGGTDDGTLLTLGNPVTAQLAAGTRDEWTFRGQSGTVVVISMSSEEFDTVLELHGPNGRELTRNDDYGDETNSRIGPYILPTSGTFTIVARAFNVEASGDYTLMVEEGEILRGGQIDYEQTQTGELVQGDPQEWTFEGQDGDIIQINVNSDDFDSYLELELENGTLLSSNDDYNGLNSQIGPYQLPATGTFVIVVSSYSGSGTGSYTVSLRRVITTEIAYGDTVNGNLSGGESDLYEFEAAEGDVVMVRMESQQFETVLRLSDDATVLAVEYDDGDGTQIGPIMLPSDGLYMIQASAYLSSDEGDYTLSIEQVAVETVLGGEIEFGVPQTQMLIGGTQGRWEFTGTAGESIIITLYSEDFDTYLALEDPDGIQITSNDDFDGLNSQIGPFTLRDTGTYTVVASGYNSSDYGEYTLTLMRQNLIGEIAYNDSQTRTLAADVTDYWVLNANGGDVLSIRVESDDFTPQLEIRDSGNYLVYIDVNNDGGDAHIGPVSISYSDEYTIAISSTDTAGGDYTLLVEEQAIVSGGGSLNLDDATIAQLESGVHSRWKFEAQAGETVTIIMNSNDFDTVLELVDVDGNEVGYNDDYVDLNSQIGPLELPYSGTYFIIARGFNESSEGVYTLNLITGSLPTNVTGQLNYGDTTDGLLVSGNRDRWTFEGTRGDVVSIVLASNDFDTYLSLEFGSTILASNDDYEGRNSQIRQINLPSDGTYTIVVEGYFSDASGSYTLSLSIQGGITIDTSNAEMIAYNDTVTGNLRGESAVYQFEGNGGDMVVITMSSEDIDSYLELYDSEGGLIEANDDFDGLNAQIGPLELPTDGTYTIVATSFGNVAGSYTLSLVLSDETSSTVPADDGETTVEVDDLVPVGIEVGQRAPDFTLQTIDGDTTTLWDLRGQVVLINFWATWCEPCRDEMPALDIVYQEYQSVGFTIIGVDVRENESLVRGFLIQTPVTFPLVLDDTGNVAAMYNIEFFPTSFIVDEEGIIRRILIGSTNARTLRYELEYIGLERPEAEE